MKKVKYSIGVEYCVKIAFFINKNIDKEQKFK